MEVALVRKKLKSAIDQARTRAQQRRIRTAEAERAYTVFLETVAIPIARNVQNALKAEGHHFTLFTPGGGLRLALDRGRDDYVEFLLDTAGPQPHVIGRISRTRGSRTLEEERTVKAGTAPEQLTEDDVLEFLLEALGPWLEP